MRRAGRGRRAGGPLAAVAVLGAALAAAPRPAAAWNPLKAAADGLHALGRATIGALAGGIVEGATTPTIHDAEDAGRRLLADADKAIGAEIDHVGTVTSGVVAQVDADVAHQLATVDQSLAARIVQVKTGVDDTIDRTFGRLDDALGRLDAIAARRIAQVDRAVQGALAHVDRLAATTLAKADDILGRRLGDVRALVDSSIAEADRAAAARIAQLDEDLGKRLGNLDTIATKQSLGLESMLLELAARVALVVFVAFVLWRLFAEAARGWKDAGVGGAKRLARVGAAARGGAPRWGVQVVFAAAGAGGLWWLAQQLPRDARARAAAQIADHDAALTAALAAHDFAGVRYHASQLELLAPAQAHAHDAAVLEAELVHDVFTRPAQLRTLDGVGAVMAQVAAVEAAAGGSDDPDVLVVKCFVLWQVAASRADEAEAAGLCAQALDAGRRAPRALTLGPLARSYVRAFLHDPYRPSGAAVDADPGPLEAALAPIGGEPADRGELAAAIEYDDLAAKLDGASTAAYLRLLDAQARLEAARASGGARGGGAGRGAAGATAADSDAAAKARADRSAAAEAVIAAWRDFDDALSSSAHLAGDPAALAAFTLDDAVLTHALYVRRHPERDALPPELMQRLGDHDVDPLDPATRVAIAPLRVAWARRDASLLGPSARDVLDYQEAQRFKAFEQRDHDFAAAYVAFERARAAAGTRPDELERLGVAAATAAAQLGLYRDADGRRGRVAEQLLAELRAAHGAEPAADVRAAIDDAYRARRLRFL